MRRYAVQNKLTRLVTLTWAPSHGGPGHYEAGIFKCTAGAADDQGYCVCGRPWGAQGRDAALAAGKLWTRRFRDAHGHFPYLLVAEQHKDGHWHLHAAVGREVALLVLDDARWNLGRVDAGTDLRGKGSMRDMARLAAAYCSKYAGKETAGVDSRRQAYRVAEGFKVRVQSVGFFVAFGDALDAARLTVGDRISEVWKSPDEWDGPPCAIVTFAEHAPP